MAFSSRKCMMFVTIATILISAFGVNYYVRLQIGTLYVQQDSALRIQTFNKKEKELNQITPGISHKKLCQGSDANEEMLLVIEKFEEICDPFKVHDIRGWENRTVLDVLKHLLSSELKGQAQKLNPAVCPRTLSELTDSNLGIVSLLSYPGSGNTWTRNILQELTGKLTGSVYNDGDLKRHGFPGEGKWKNMIAVKTHSPNKAAEARNPVYTRQIILLRNPYDALVAEYKRRRLHMGHKGDARIDHTKPAFKAFVKSAVKTWPRRLNATLTNPWPTHVVFYEDLKTCLLPELIYLASFLINNRLSAFSFCCALKEHEGLHHRKVTSSNYLLYDTKQKEAMNGMLKQLAKDVRQEHPVLSFRLKQYQWK